MRPTAARAFRIGVLLALAIGPSRVRAQQGYAYVVSRRPAYGAAPGHDYAYPQRPTYVYARPRAYVARPTTPTYYDPQARRRGLGRVRAYSNRDSTPYKDIEVDPDNPHWTFDDNEWMARNF